MAVEGGIENWGVSDQIRELFSMAVSQNNQGRSELRYMDLDAFQRAKTNHEYLADYSTLPGVTEISPGALFSPGDIQRIKAEKAQLKREAEEKRLCQEREAREQAAEAERLAKEQAAREQAEKQAEEEALRKDVAMATGLSVLEGQTGARRIAGIVKNYHVAKGGDLTPEELALVRTAIFSCYQGSGKKDRQEWKKEPKKSKFWSPMRDALGGTNVIKEWQKDF